MDVSSDDACVSASHTLPTSSADDPACIDTPLVPVMTLQAEQSTSSAATLSPSLSPDTKLHPRLHDQLHQEMNKRRPDHFVIGVTCRSLGEVPSELRSQVWKELLGVTRSEQLCLDQSILQVEEDLDNQRVIAADAARTRSNEPRFQQPETVELVVKLLTYYCKYRSIRYKQGMNEVLAPFLLLTEQRNGSEDRVPLAEGVVFQCFDALIDRFLPHVFVDKEFRSLQCSLQLYRLLMLYHDPELCHYLDQHHMTPELYVTPWFMTLFARSLPPALVFYLWDFFLLEEDPYLLHFVAYALVAANRHRIFEAEIPMLPQVLSSFTFSSRDELEQICTSALSISEMTPRSFKRDLYSVCYDGFTDAMVPFLDQLYACSSLQVYPEELVRTLLDRLATTAKQKTPEPSPAVQELTRTKDSLNPLLSPKGDREPLLYVPESGDEDSTALKFILLDCRPAEEYHKSHLSLSHHIDPSIMGRPDALDGLMKGFSHMKGCHFCFVGPSVDTVPDFSRSSAMDTIVRLARSISSDKSQHSPTQEQAQKAVGVTVTGDIIGETLSSTSFPTGPVELSRKQSPGEPGALASEIGSSGAAMVHAEHVSVTRLVLMFLQKGFKYVSRLDGGFNELERSIRNMDTFAQEQLLVSSPFQVPTNDPIPSSDSSSSSSSGGFNLFAKIGLTRSRTPSQDDFVIENTGSTRSEVSDTSNNRTLTLPSAPTSGALNEVMEVMKKTKSKTKMTTSSAVSSFSQRLMSLKAAAKDAVSLTSSSSVQSSKSTEERTIAGEEGWVEVCVTTREAPEEISLKTTDVELQEGPIGILFQKARTSKKYQAVVDSVVSDSQASATGLINTGDLLVSINGTSLEDVAFLNVIERIITASRPLLLQFHSPPSVQKEKETSLSDAIAVPPLPPALVSATRHSICITWDKIPAKAVPTAMARYQLQFAKQSDDEFNPWLPITMKQEGTTAEVDTTGTTDQTNGTMVGLDQGEALVFRVRCGDGQKWGPYSLSSGSMSTLDVQTTGAASGTLTPTRLSEDATTAVFLPGVCPEYVEKGRFFYRVLLALRARRRPDFNAEKLDIILDQGLIIRGSERLVCPGSNQVFVRLAFGNMDEDGEYERKDSELMLLHNGTREADDDADGMWAFENTPAGDVVLERLPESAVEEIGPSFQEQAKSMVQAFLTSHGIAPTNGGMSDNVNSNSATSISSVVSTTTTANSSTMSLVAPQMLQVFPASSSEVIVTWDPVIDTGVTKYQIQYVKDRLAAMWWTVKPDINAETLKYSVTGLQSNTCYLFRIRSGTEDNKWSPYSESSEKCRTFAMEKLSVSSSSDEDGETSSIRSTGSTGKKLLSLASNPSAPQSAPVRTGSTILDKAVAVASRLRRRSASSSSPQVDEVPVSNKENVETQQDEEELEVPSSRHVDLASWKSSSSAVHKDFRFYHAIKFEEQDEDSEGQLSRLGERELVITPSVLIVLTRWQLHVKGSH